jgi:hypothetical protein
MSEALDTIHGYLTALASAKYSVSVARFLLQHGRAYVPGRTMTRGVMKACYLNAFRLVSEEDFDYAEGYAIHHGVSMPVLHAWAVDHDGKVVEPTWSRALAYFGIRLDSSYVIKEYMRRGECFSFLDDWTHHHPLLTQEGLAERVVLELRGTHA